jgi:hypothetical protein
MRKLALLTLIGAALQVAACGNDPLDMEQDNEGGTTEAEERGTSAPSGRTTAEPESAATRSKNTAKRRLIYLDARTLCGEFGVRQVVNRFGVEPGSASDVARAYADRNYSAPFQDAGYRGCLTGFRK